MRAVFWVVGREQRAPSRVVAAVQGYVLAGVPRWEGHWPLWDCLPSGHVASAEPPVHRWLRVVMQALWESVLQTSDADIGGLLRIVGTVFQLHFI